MDELGSTTILIASKGVTGSGWFFPPFSSFHHTGEIAQEAMAAKSYDEALQILSSAPVVSSNYFILAGVDGQGAGWALDVDPCTLW